VPDVLKTVSLDAKLPGDLLYILAETNNEMAGSEYASMLQQDVIPEVRSASEAESRDDTPSVDVVKNYQLYKKLYQAIQQNLVASSISISRGGFIIALLKKLMGGGLGAEVSLKNMPGEWQKNYEALFSESQGRILVTVAPQNKEKFERIMKGQTFSNIGKISKDNQVIIKDYKGKTITDLKITEALEAYKSTFKHY
jgi:phosphoribosylformylglycinamidine synthase